MKKKELLYKTGIPSALYAWIALPIAVTLCFWLLGMGLFGAAFYGLISLVIYLASNPDYCSVYVYEDHLKLVYFRLFNRTHEFYFTDFDTVKFKRGELFHALPFLFKPVRLNDYLEFTVSTKRNENISINVKCNRNAIQHCVQIANLHNLKSFEKA